MTHSFAEKLEFSLGEREYFDISLLKTIISGCTDIHKTDAETDKTGVDYIATLRRGATINIDAKTREKGASRFWQYNQPELALEIWSVVPNEVLRGKTGWTLDESSAVDYILYTFDKSDSDRYYFLPFHLLRLAFINNYAKWMNKYKVKRQNSGRWQSEAVFVPAAVVVKEIENLMSGCKE